MARESLGKTQNATAGKWELIPRPHWNGKGKGIWAECWQWLLYIVDQEYKPSRGMSTPHQVQSLLLRLEGDLMRRDTNALMPGGGHLQETAGTLNGINQGTVYKGEDRVLGDHSVLRVFLTSWAKETKDRGAVPGTWIQEKPGCRAGARGINIPSHIASSNLWTQQEARRRPRRVSPLGHRSGGEG